MSLLDGFAEAIASVPPVELKFNISELNFIGELLNHYSNYLNDRDADEQPVLYGDDGRTYHEILDDIWKMFMNYKFH